MVHCKSSGTQDTKDFNVKHLIVYEGWCEDMEEKAALWNNAEKKLIKGIKWHYIKKQTIGKSFKHAL